MSIRHNAKKLIVTIAATLLSACGVPAADGRDARATGVGNRGAPADLPAKAERGTVPIAAAGDAYADARQRILADGWAPRRGACEGAGLNAPTCTAFPELDECTGVGEGLCGMTFTRAAMCLSVVTVGGAPSDADGARVRSTSTRRCPTNKETAMADDGTNGPTLTSFAAPVCARFAEAPSAGPAKTDILSQEIPVLAIMAQEIEDVAIDPDEIEAIARGLTCASGLSGDAPYIADSALTLFNSERHGSAMRRALKALTSDADARVASAARRLQTMLGLGSP